MSDLLVLDTHAWVWLVNEPSNLSDPAAAQIEAADALAVSAFSVWEIALLVELGRLGLDQPTVAWTNLAITQNPRLREVPVDSAIALEAIELKKMGLRGDPVDQIVLATAKRLGARLVTKDRVLRKFAPELTVW